MKDCWKIVVSGIIGVFGGGILTGKRVKAKANELISQEQKLSEKNLDIAEMLNEWVMIKQVGKKLDEYFIHRGINKIAVYGMNYLGITVLREFENSSVKIAYGIDKNGGSHAYSIRICTLLEQLEEVDAVIVTPIAYYDEIRMDLKEKINCLIVPLDEVIREVKQGAKIIMQEACCEILSNNRMLK